MQKIIFTILQSGFLLNDKIPQRPAVGGIGISYFSTYKHIHIRPWCWPEALSIRLWGLSLETTSATFSNLHRCPRKALFLMARQTWQHPPPERISVWRHSGFFPRGMLLIQLQLTSGVSMPQNSAWKTLQRMWASWFVSDFPSATESVRHGLALTLLEPHAQRGHGKSPTCCHHPERGGADRGESQYKGSSSLQCGFRSWLWHY